jgi:hypothetical protein
VEEERIVNCSNQVMVRPPAAVPSYTPGHVYSGAANNESINRLRSHIEGVQTRSTQRRETLESILTQQRREIPRHNSHPLQSARETASRILNEPHYKPKPYGSETADMLQNAGLGIVNTLNKICIPGYSAYVSGGSIPEVAASAVSDAALTLVGGNAAKMVTGAKTLFKGTKPLLKSIPQVPLIEKPVLLPSTKVADHHIFPQKYRPFFENLGIEIDKYTVSLGQTTHLRGIHGKGNADLPGKWNDRWKEFLQQNPRATSKDVYQFAGQLMDEYKLNKEVLHVYRK